MKLAYRDLEPFVKSPRPEIRVILVYGPDDGLMRERAKTMGRTVVADLNDPFNVSILKAGDLVADPARLFDEAAAQSMLGGRRLIRVEDGRDSLSPLLKDYLKAPNDNALLIIEAGELGARSPLRMLIEKAANAAAVACYVDEARDVAGLARATLSAAGYAIAPDALNWLAAAITGDRARIRSELEKLILYMGAIKDDRHRRRAGRMRPTPARNRSTPSSTPPPARSRRMRYAPIAPCWKKACPSSPSCGRCKCISAACT